MPQSSHSTAISLNYLTWINEELRKEVERRRDEAEQNKLKTRMKSAFTAALSAVSLCFLGLLK